METDLTRNMGNNEANNTMDYNITQYWNFTMGFSTAVYNTSPVGHVIVVSESGTMANVTMTDDNSSSGYAKETIIYILIGVIGALGNSFVIMVMLSSKEVRRKIPNILIIHQSVIDAFTSALLILTSTNTYDNAGGQYGIKGELYCRIWAMKVPLWSAFMVSTYNLLVLTVERYIEIVHPIYHKVSFGRVHLSIAMILVWIIGFAYNFLLTGLTSGTSSGQCELMTNWPSEFARNAVGVLTFVLEYLLPLLVMIFCYSKIAWILKTKAKVVPIADNSSRGNNSTNVAVRSSLMSKARRNVIKTLFIVCLCFVACWTWNQVFFLLYNTGHEVSFTTGFYHFTVYAAFINSCINPFIYIVQLTSFRNAVRLLFGCSTNSVIFESSTVHKITVQPVK